MACGVAVVVTPEVGLADAVRGAHAGLVIGGEPNVLGPAMAGLLTDPARRGEMGRRGAAAARERFAWASIAEQTSLLYHQIVGGTARNISLRDHSTNARANQTCQRR
jgi:glycosyltransferase involved in cell wall biosynthesis